MQRRRDTCSYGYLLQRCSEAKSLFKGKELHAQIIRDGYDRDTYIGNLIVQMYGNCGCITEAHIAFQKIRAPSSHSWNIMLTAYARNGYLEKAKLLFDASPSRNSVSWTAMITAYAKHEQGKESIKLFQRMDLEGEQATALTYVSMLNACSSIAALKEGRIVHENVLADGLEANVRVGTALINMYAKCGHVEYARSLFDNMPDRNSVSWNTMISACEQNGYLQEARRIFDIMPDPDAVSWTTMICAYAHNGYLLEGKQIFDEMPQRHSASWNAMITAYSQKGHDEEAIQLFQKMQLEGMKVDKVSFICALNACAGLKALNFGKTVHASVVECYLKDDVEVAAALLDMYGKCGSIDATESIFESISQPSIVAYNAMIAAYAKNGLLENARSLHDKMNFRDVVSWNAMITAYAHNNHGTDALYLFKLMDLEGFQPNTVTFVGVLDACADVPSLADGKLIHAEFVNGGYAFYPLVTTAVINIYGKCGQLDEAWCLFQDMAGKTVVTWNAMISAYAQCGKSEKCLEVFKLMLLVGMQPTDATFTSILSACSHAGLLSYARQYFMVVTGDHNMVSSLDHYMCIIDLLCRSGRLLDAEDLICDMPFEDDQGIWLTVLSACKVHGDVNLGAVAAMKILKFNPELCSPYVLFSNICKHDVADPVAILQLSPEWKKKQKSSMAFSATLH